MSVPHNGLLLIDKPKGLSSFDVLRALKRQLHMKKMGHTGTLDPMATGLLVVCLGEGTKLVQYLTADEKRYEGTIDFRYATDTYDAEGQCTTKSDPTMVEQLTQLQIRQCLQGMHGIQQQRPPIFSAIKVNGQRLYERARRGDSVEAPLRTIDIKSLILLHYQSPFARIDVTSSKGTYIRSLAFDIGQDLELSSHLCELRRLSCGHLSIADAHELDTINQESIQSQLIPLSMALPWPQVIVNEREVIALTQGRSLFHTSPPEKACAVDHQGNLIALLHRQEGVLKVLRGFNTRT